MSTTALFKTNVFIKDWEKDDQWNENIKTIANASLMDHVAKTGELKKHSLEDGIPFFTEENLEKFEDVKELFEMFVEGFWDLHISYADENPESKFITKNDIANALMKETGKVPLMEKGDHKKLHTHKRTSAFAIFYLDDVDNEKDGGLLRLHDPAFNNLDYFHGQICKDIPTVKHRMIVAPTSIWHEVSPYFGDETRTTVVINLHGKDLDDVLTEKSKGFEMTEMKHETGKYERLES